MAERQTVLVVGASAGIGRAIAAEFARLGFDLVLIARRPEPLLSVAADIARNSPVGITTLALDATAADAPDRIAATLDASAGRLAYAVIGIGAWEQGPAATLSALRLRALLDTNVTAPHALAARLAPRLSPTGGILVIGSLAGTLPLPWLSAYAASKAALHAHALALRQELAATGPGVSVLAPGVVRTGFLPPALAGRWQGLVDLLASHPETVGRAACRGLLANRALIVPGLLWRGLWLGMRLLPASLLVRLSRRLLLPLAESRTIAVPRDPAT